MSGDPGADALITLFLLFCRVGACFMILPGLSIARVPPQIRLFVAIAISAALLASLGGELSMNTIDQDKVVAAIIAGEIIIGLFLGFLVRIFYLALEFSATAMANYAGYGSVFAPAIDDDRGSGSFSELVTLTTVALFFVMDLHVAAIQMLRTSYATFPVGSWMDAAVGIDAISLAFREAFTLTLQLSAPLLVYSLTINFAFGLLNKLVPQIPIYFISFPFVITGGLFILMQSESIILQSFMTAVRAWIERVAVLG